MAYPGDYHEDSFDWTAHPRPRRLPRKASIESGQPPMNASVAVTAMGLVFASLLAGGLLAAMLFAPKDNHSATTFPADVMAGVAR